jgi:hypothetical protein
MSFHFHNQPFWGLLVIAPDHHHLAVEPVGEARFRPRLTARWQRGADGRLERHWHRQPMTSQPD